MKKWVLLLLVIGAFVYIYSWRAYWFMKLNFSSAKISSANIQEPPGTDMKTALDQLRERKDDDAWLSFQKVLKASNDSNLDALWGKAEILRRKRDFAASEELLVKTLSLNPEHARSLLTLSYIKMKRGAFSEAEYLIARALDNSGDTDTAGMAYMMLGTLNAARLEKGTIVDKLNYTLQVKCFFERARELAPGLPEPHLALGTFYLLAPRIIGGDMNKALIELNSALKIAPDFATVNARIAQYSRKRYDYERYNSYKDIAERLDPGNEVLKELTVNR